jgi:hypothetical protein
MESDPDKNVLFRYRIECKSAIGAAQSCSTTSWPLRRPEEEFNQIHCDKEIGPPELAPLFSIRTVLEAKCSAYCRSVLEFSWNELLQLYEIAKPLLRPNVRKRHPKTEPIDQCFVFL